MGCIWGKGDYPLVSHPTTAIFQYHEVLQTFLLVANYPGVGYRLPSILIDAMQLLIEGGSI